MSGAAAKGSQTDSHEVLGDISSAFAPVAGVCTHERRYSSPDGSEDREQDRRARLLNGRRLARRNTRPRSATWSRGRPARGRLEILNQRTHNNSNWLSVKIFPDDQIREGLPLNCEDFRQRPIEERRPRFLPSSASTAFCSVTPWRLRDRSCSTRLASWAWRVSSRSAPAADIRAEIAGSG